MEKVAIRNSLRIVFVANRAESMHATPDMMSAISVETTSG